MSKKWNCPYKKQAKHNEKFHDSTCKHFPDDFFDWKITVLFYTGIQYVKALANQLGIQIGNSHHEIRGNIKPSKNGPANGNMVFSRKPYEYYDFLYVTSQKVRYEGFYNESGAFTDDDTFTEIIKADHRKCEEALLHLKNYLILNRGLEE